MQAIYPVGRCIANGTPLGMGMYVIKKTAYLQHALTGPDPLSIRGAKSVRPHRPSLVACWDYLPCIFGSGCYELGELQLPYSHCHTCFNVAISSVLLFDKLHRQLHPTVQLRLIR